MRRSLANALGGLLAILATALAGWPGNLDQGERFDHRRACFRVAIGEA
jgi:hypothetical protein